MVLHDLSLPWFVCRTEYRQEYAAVASIAVLGFRTHLARSISRKRGHLPRILLLFPGYLFVQFDPECDPWRSLYNAKGVDYLFCSGVGGDFKRPLPIKAGVVEELMSRGRAGDGIIDDEAPAFPRLMPGSPVRVASGAFDGWRGVVSWSSDERVRVMLSLLGGEREVAMPRAAVELVA